MPVVSAADAANGLISKEEVQQRCQAEQVDFSKVYVLIAQWAESGPRAEGVRSALVTSDLIIRSDGTVVYLDGWMSNEGKTLARLHMAGQSNPRKLPWDEFVQSVTLPADQWPK